MRTNSIDTVNNRKFIENRLYRLIGDQAGEQIDI